jgi:CRISPR-associated protein Cmr3
MLLWPDGTPQKKEGNQWLHEDQLLQLLKPGTKSPIVGESETKLFARESRLGIARNERRTTEEGALYEVEFIRPYKDVGLLLEVEGYDGWPTTGVIRIGGEGRGAHFKEVNAEPWPTPPNPLPKQFLLYFATPTYFAHGWQPETWDRFFEGEVKLQAAAVNRFQSVGGFDWAANSHKPARRYVPAGAVYFFESNGEARLKPDLVQNAITDTGAEIGFGQILIERW